MKQGFVSPPNGVKKDIGEALRLYFECAFMPGFLGPDAKEHIDRIAKQNHTSNKDKSFARLYFTALQLPFDLNADSFDFIETMDLMDISEAFLIATNTIANHQHIAETTKITLLEKIITRLTILKASDDDKFNPVLELEIDTLQSKLNVLRIDTTCTSTPQPLYPTLNDLPVSDSLGARSSSSEEPPSSPPSLEPASSDIQKITNLNDQRPISSTEFYEVINMLSSQLNRISGQLESVLQEKATVTAENKKLQQQLETQADAKMRSEVALQNAIATVAQTFTDKTALFTQSFVASCKTESYVPQSPIPWDLFRPKIESNSSFNTNPISDSNESTQSASDPNYNYWISPNYD